MHDYKAQSIAYEQGICKHQTRTVDDILWTSLSQLQTSLSYGLYNNQLVRHTNVLLSFSGPTQLPVACSME